MKTMLFFVCTLLGISGIAQTTLSYEKIGIQTHEFVFNYDLSGSVTSNDLPLIFELSYTPDIEGAESVGYVSPNVVNSISGSVTITVSTSGLIANTPLQLPLGVNYKFFGAIVASDWMTIKAVTNTVDVFLADETTTGVASLNVDSKSFYPNPVTATEQFFAATDAELYDVQGKLIQKIQAGANTIHAVPGMYLVKNTAGNVSRLAVK